MELTEGSTWNVKVGDGPIRHCRIMELGFATVTLMELPFSHIKRTHERNVVRFIERTDGPND